ncbi:MAG: alanine racemase [Epsilonproteobacteria bacterium]|nr:alanine racemase [Campylobacterota bacterium]
MAYIKLSKSNLFANVDNISNTSNCEILAVIKDNAYGHGIVQIAKMLQQKGIQRVCVRNNDEAMLVKDYFKEVLVFFPTLCYNSPNISYTISDIKQLRRSKHKKIHLKFDTGMHRNALSMDEVDEVLKLAFDKFEVRGIFSHFCCSDEIGCDTFIQLDRFKKLKDRVVAFCKLHNLDLPKFHLANSAGVFRLKDFSMFDYVRVGIALYGGMEDTKPVMSLYAKALKQQMIYKNQAVGYNKTYTFCNDTMTTLVDIGYSDGILYFDKELQLKDTLAVGKISMDSMMVIGEYDEVCVFDDVKEFAKNYPNTITYDILAKLKPHLKRVICD